MEAVADRPSRWQRSLAAAVRDPDVLCDRLHLDDAVRAAARGAAGLFPLVVTESFLARMTPGDPLDPLLRQVLPLDAESAQAPRFVADPTGDAAVTVAPGLLHKYRGRALLVATGVCAVHCRYCFRRHFPYDQVPRGASAWQPALDRIAADRSIREVILSGGDPLTLPDAALARLVDRLADIPHVRRLRIHTRMPVVLPERVTDDLLDLLTASRLQPVVVIHANHANELVADAADALRRLHAVMLFNQSVLLRGVNDDADTLADLSERLVELGVVPYYLHQLDAVAGAAHFEVPENRGRELSEELRDRLPGYMTPRYVREIPGADAKTPL